MIHPDYASYEAPETKAPDLRNVQSVLRAKKGDIEKGFGESDKIFEIGFKPRWCIRATSSPTHARWKSTPKEESCLGIDPVAV